MIVKVLEQNNSKWKTILKDSILHFNTWNHINDYAFEDFNGDKILDLKILKNFCNIGSCQEYEAWVYETGSFLKVKNFNEISFDKYDSTQNIIYTRSSYGSRSFRFGKYRVNKNVLQKLDNISCYFDETTNECIVTINDKEIKCNRKEAYKIVSKDYSDWVYGLWNE